MNRRAVITGLALAPFAHADTNSAAERQKFIGMWRLIAGESKDQTTEVVSYPWGRTPFGRLLYDDAGRVFVQLMNPGRRTVGGVSNRGAAAAIASLSPDNMREMLTGFNAYFGNFDIDQAAGTVIHHLESALIPSWVGTDQRRRYEFSAAGELILLNTASGADYRLVWQRDDKRAK
jgi:hypothetical protein